MTLRGSALKRSWEQSGGWRRNGQKVKQMKQRDLSGVRQSPAGVRGVVVALKPGNSGGAKDSRKMDGVMTRQSESTPAIVPLAQQAGAAHPLWVSAKPCVWTVRMLTALIEGVEGGKWFRLIDKVFSERNLLTAFQQVASRKGAAGVDHVKVDEFSRQVPENLWQLSDALKAGTYRPQSIRRVNIPKPGTKETRPLAPLETEQGRRCVIESCRRRL